MAISKGDCDMCCIEEIVSKGLSALEMFVYSLSKPIAEMIVVSGGIDALVFTVGIDEHSALSHQKL